MINLNCTKCTQFAPKFAYFPISDAKSIFFWGGGRAPSQTARSVPSGEGTPIPTCSHTLLSPQSTPHPPSPAPRSLLLGYGTRTRAAPPFVNPGAHVWFPTLLFKETIPDYGCGVHHARREGGGVPGPRDVTGAPAPPSLKNAEKGVARGFLLTSNVHKIHFRPGICPETRWGSL